MIFFEIHLYRSPAGTSPVEEFLGRLPTRDRAKIMAAIDYLSREGPGLRRPQAAHVRGKIWELRVSLARNEYRVLYFFTVGQKVVLLHAFQKKTAAIPAREIETAEARQRQYEERMKKGKVIP